MAQVILFDVNETLLDVKALRPLFEQLFGDGAALGEWFAQLLRLAFVVTITDAYQDFGVVGRAALQMVAVRRGVALADEGVGQVVAGIRSLPPHPEVPAALQRLQNAGLRLATLTNSPPPILQAQMENAGLAGYFEQLLSVHPTRRFKPAREPYIMAAASLGVRPDQVRMVAAHDWDTDGAMRAGCAAAFIARPGMVLGPLSEKPDIVGRDLAEVAGAILAVDGV